MVGEKHTQNIIEVQAKTKILQDIGFEVENSDIKDTYGYVIISKEYYLNSCSVVKKVYVGSITFDKSDNRTNENPKGFNGKFSYSDDDIKEVTVCESPIQR